MSNLRNDFVIAHTPFQKIIFAGFLLDSNVFGYFNIELTNKKLKDMLAKSQSDALTAVSQQHSQEAVSDRALWLSIKSGNELSFSILYKRYAPLLYNYAMHNCRDRDIAMDSLQEIFASIWDGRKRLSDVYAVNTYVFKSFRRLLVKKVMWRNRFSLSLDGRKESSFECILPVEHAIEQDEIDSEWRTKLSRSLNKLTKRQREALFLKFYNGLDYADIAAIMDLQVDSAYNLISKALDALRGQMAHK